MTKSLEITCRSHQSVERAPTRLTSRLGRARVDAWGKSKIENRNFLSLFQTFPARARAPGRAGAGERLVDIDTRCSSGQMDVVGH